MLFLQLFTTTYVFSADANTLNGAVYKSSIATLDPHVVSSTEKCINYMTYESLVSRFRDTIEITPKLATSWDVSKDVKVFTFKLRKGVTFHDGIPFNANAVKFNFDRVNSLKKGFYWMLANAKLEKVEVLDEFSVRFVLKEGFSPFISIIRVLPDG